MNYTLNFLDSPESDRVGDDLDDFEGSFLPLLGKEFYISDWKNITGTDKGGITGKLTLLDSASRGLVREGETVTLSVEGTSYDVSIDFIDADSTALLVNGQTTNDLLKGETEKLPDGTYVGITDVRRLVVAGEIGTVEFSLGKGKLELENNAEIQLNDDTVSDVRSFLRTSATSIDKIVIEWKADEELFITPDSDITLPGLGGIKFSMGELVRSEEDLLTIQNDGDDSMELRIPIKDGTASINLMFSNATDGMIGIGEATDKRLATSPTGRLTFWEKKNNLDYHSYFVASYNDSDNGESYLLDLRAREDTGNSRNETDVYNVVTGLFEATDKVATDEVTIGDVSFTIEFIHVNATDEYVNITAGTNTLFNTVYSKGGLRVFLPFDVGAGTSTSCAVGGDCTIHGVYTSQETETRGSFNNTIGNVAPRAGHNNVTWHLSMIGEDKDDNIASGSGFEVRFAERLSSTTSTELYVDQVNTTGIFSATGGVQGEEQGNTNIYEAYVYDPTAPQVLHYTDPDQDWAEVRYSAGDESETYARVFLTDVGSTGGVGTAGGLSVMDVDLATSGMQTKNLVVVGGTCVNSAHSCKPLELTAMKTTNSFFLKTMSSPLTGTLFSLGSFLTNKLYLTKPPSSPLK